MLLNSSAWPVPGPCASRMIVPSSMFQSTSALISVSSPCALSASIQPRRSPKAVGLRSTDIWSFRVWNIVVVLLLFTLGRVHSYASPRLSSPRKRGPIVPHTAASGIWVPAFAGTTVRCRAIAHASLHEPLRRRRNLGDEITHQALVGERGECHLARGEPRGAGIDRGAVQFHHAFLASIGVDAGEADGE